jgi:hypothetical protein
MNIEDLRAQLESEHTWRADEIRLLRNNLSTLPSGDQDRARKALVVMLYAHLEGFCKAAFSIYVEAVNGEQISCSDVNFAIATATVADAIGALEDPSRKSDFFRQTMPDDSALHRFARQREFMERLSELLSRPVRIPTDLVVDTESNLSPRVLRKILFRLGFDHLSLEPEEGLVKQLVNARHDIAHGKFKTGYPADQYVRVEAAAFRVIETVKHLIWSALSEQWYRKTA